MSLIENNLVYQIERSMFHKDICEILMNISNNDMPHLLFYGPKGSGKKTLINILLNLLFNINPYILNDTKYMIQGCGNKTFNINIKQSDHHIIIKPQNNNFDKYLIQYLIKKYAQCDTLIDSKKTFRVIIIDNIDKLSFIAQTSLRRTMEKYSKYCRFVMWGHNISKVIDPIKSRSLVISVPTPMNKEIFNYSIKIIVENNIKILFTDLVEIIFKIKNNIKKLLWSLEYLKSKNIVEGEKMEMKRINKNIINKKIDKIEALKCDINQIIYDKNNEKNNNKITNYLNKEDTAMKCVKKIISICYMINNINNKKNEKLNEEMEKEGITVKNLIDKMREIIYNFFITNYDSNVLLIRLIELITMDYIKISGKNKQRIINKIVEIDNSLELGRHDIIHIEGIFIFIINILNE